MSKLFLRILLCAGFWLSAFPILSMEKKEHGDASGRNKATLERTQQEVQKKIADYPAELEAPIIQLILNAPFVDNESFMGEPGHRSTDPVKYASDKWVTAKVLGDVFNSLRKAVDPQYVALFLTDTDVDLKISTFHGLPNAKVVSAHLDIVAKRIDILQLGYKGGDTATSKQKEHDDKVVESDLTKYQLMVRKKAGEKTVEIPLCYPVKQILTTHRQQMVDAILTLNFTFFKKRAKETDELTSLQSLAQSLAISEMVLPSVNEGKKVKKKPEAKATSPKKGPRSPAKGEGIGSAISSSATSHPSSIPPRIGAASTPKPSFLKKLEGTQAQTQRLLRYAPDTLDLRQISLIVKSPTGVSIGQNIWATAKNDVSLLPKALCAAYIVDGTPFAELTESEVAIMYKFVIGVADEYDLQTHYTGPTVSAKLNQEISAAGTLKRYLMKNFLNNDIIKYPNSGDNMISAYLELSLTITEKEEKEEDKA